MLQRTAQTASEPSSDCYEVIQREIHRIGAMIIIGIVVSDMFGLRQSVE